MAAPRPSWCPSLGTSTPSLPPCCCLSLQSLVWSESQSRSYLSFTTPPLCLSVLWYPWGGISPPPLSISSHVLRTSVFICLSACHVPEPALISIPRNAVYLPRCCQEERGGEEKASETRSRKRGRADWKNQRAVRLLRVDAGGSTSWWKVKKVKELSCLSMLLCCLFSAFHQRCTEPKISSH